MREADLPAFQARLDAVCSMLSRGRYVPDPVAGAVAFRALEDYPLADVLAAFDAHVKDRDRGRFPPVPADLIAQLEKHAADDGRPGSDEAWAIALASADERDTVVWSDEIAEAFTAARPVLAAGDEVGARMAFRQTYDRLVGAGRRAGRAVQWQASLGSDPERRALAIAAATRAGRATSVEDDALRLPSASIGTLLLAADGAPAEGVGIPAPPEARAALRALRDRLAARTDDPSADAQARAATAAAQAKTRAQLLTVDETVALVDGMRQANPELLGAMQRRAETQHLQRGER